MNVQDVAEVYRILACRYRGSRAPVVALQSERTTDPFRILATTVLSARTRDETTLQAARRLFAKIQTPADLARLTEKQVRELIYPVGFSTTKARHLKALATALNRRDGGAVPSTIDALCALPGVGRKTANLVLTAAFDQPAICVDVHVHRLCNRWGLLATRTPTQTEMTLRRILPRRYWKRWNPYLVSCGQTVCTPLRPRCDRCPLLRYCSRIGLVGECVSVWVGNGA